MKLVEWTDENGYKRGSLLRHSDPDVLRKSGVPIGPPDIDRIDWEGVKRDLHNQLYAKRLFEWKDVVAKQTAIKAVVQTVLRKRVVMLYRELGGTNESEL